MACGTPVVGFDTGGIPDMVRPGVTGELATVGDAAALREAIRRVLKRPETWPQLSANCRRIVLDEYSLERQASSYQRFYRTIVVEQAEAQLEAAMQPPGPCMA
jgi:glycosyltransferase involved in cell wall biosynthesis